MVWYLDNLDVCEVLSLTLGAAVCATGVPQLLFVPGNSQPGVCVCVIASYHS